MIELEGRDMDVPLSALGERQASALGRWFCEQRERPTAIVASPFARAYHTARAIADEMGDTCELVIDERLREKEFGSLDRLTRAGITAKFPHEAEQRARIGKFYYRPPGGESWCDVALRIRSLLEHLATAYRGERVLLVSHQVVVLCARYVIEHLDEETILAIDAKGDVVNCGLTSYRGSDDGSVELEAYNFAAPMDETATPVTDSPDRTGARA